MCPDPSAPQAELSMGICAPRLPPKPGHSFTLTEPGQTLQSGAAASDEEPSHANRDNDLTVANYNCLPVLSVVFTVSRSRVGMGFFRGVNPPRVAVTSFRLSYT